MRGVVTKVVDDATRFVQLVAQWLRARPHEVPVGVEPVSRP
jgi:hypothetical protein